MKKNILTDAQKFSLVKREATFTGLALFGLIIFWLVAGFGTSQLDIKIFHLPLWAVLGSFGVWIFAIGISFFLSRKLFKDIDLEEKFDSEKNSSLLIPHSTLKQGGGGND